VDVRRVETRGMDVERAAELLESAVESVFLTMLGSEVESSGFAENPSPFLPAEVLSLIGLTGAVRGYVAIGCTREHARDITARLLGAEGHEIESLDDMRDAMGELANMLAGSVKAGLDSAEPVELTLPTVIMSKSDVRVRATLSVASRFRDQVGELTVEFVLSEDSWQR